MDWTEDLRHLSRLTRKVERRQAEVAADKWLAHDYDCVHRDLVAASATLSRLHRHAAVDEADYPVRS